MPKIDYYINPQQQREASRFPVDSSAIMDESIIRFHRKLPGYKATSLYSLHHLASELNIGEILLKDESTRFTVGAFKSLGASWAIHNFISKNTGKYTFCTATDGNHGRAVAWSARIFDQKAVVFMPAGSVEARIEFIRQEGAEVIIVEGDYDAAVERAATEAFEKDYILVQDTSWEFYEDIPRLIMAGYSTQMREIDEIYEYPQFPPFDIVILQSGVGSWAASVAVYLLNRYGENSPRIVIVEPSESDCLLESVKRGTITKTCKSQNTIMAGLNCGSPSLIAWKILKETADAFISIPDEWTCKAIRLLSGKSKLNLTYDSIPIIETCESGAAGLGALLAIMQLDELLDFRGQLGINTKTRFQIINTEGITDPVMFNNINGV